MRRLQYTRDAFLRRISMSYESSVFVLVEGKSFDPRFAEKICESSDVIKEAGYEIRMISQIKSESGRSGGGKESILSYFDYCKKKGKLKQENAGGARNLVFLADRDSQHITGGMRRSPHMVYTVYADVEAHIFAESDEVAALSLAASLDSNDAKDLVNSLGDWRTDVARSWRYWIELCYVAEATRSRSWVGLSHMQSRIHDGRRCRILNQRKMSDADMAVRGGSRMESSEFDRCRNRTLSKIAAIYDKGQEASLLKGKWLPAQLYFMVSDYFNRNGGEWHDEGFRDSVTRCYFANMRMEAPGVVAMRRKIEVLLAS